jgi:NAD(P)-dependent dehydrogenase (short-subunit alcohol dehydrogenase family)
MTPSQSYSQTVVIWRYGSAVLADAVSHELREITSDVLDIPANDHGRAAVDIAEALGRGRRIDGLITMVEMAAQPGVSELDEAAARHLYEIDVIDRFMACRAATERMNSEGRIVNIVSVACQRTNGSPIIAASEAAVVSITTAMAGELAPRGIAVNACAISTPGAGTKSRSLLAAEARMVRFLAMQTPIYMTGQVVYANRQGSC